MTSNEEKKKLAKIRTAVADYISSEGCGCCASDSHRTHAEILAKILKVPKYADPPWMYQDKSKSHGGGAESHYPCMKTEDICALRIPAAENSVLLIWVTFPQLPEGLKVMEAWGFKYKTVAFTWVKTNKNGSIYMGMGRHTRSNAEICLLGTKGKGVPRKNASIYNTQLHPRTRHSEKPDAFRSDIIKLYGIEPSRLEMFARKEVPWFDLFGNEVENSIKLL